MATNLIRISRVAPRVCQRTIATSAVLKSEFPVASREKHYPKLGNREIVGYGWNGVPTYMDREEFPCPPVRFKESDAELEAVRKKEQGDWKSLSLDEKKALYRASFCQTYSEMVAPSGEWKSIIAGILLSISVTGWIMIYIKKCVYPPMASTITKEWQEKQVENMVKQRQGPIEGVGSKFDYEKNDWK